MHGHALALGIVFGERGVHFHLVLAHFGAIEGLLADQIGLGKTLLDIAQLEKHVALDVVRAVAVDVDRAGRHRRLGGIIGG